MRRVADRAGRDGVRFDEGFQPCQHLEQRRPEDAPAGSARGVLADADGVDQLPVRLPDLVFEPAEGVVRLPGGGVAYVPGFAVGAFSQCHWAYFLSSLRMALYILPSRIFATSGFRSAGCS